MRQGSGKVPRVNIIIRCGAVKCDRFLGEIGPETVGTIRLVCPRCGGHTEVGVADGVKSFQRIVQRGNYQMTHTSDAQLQTEAAVRDAYKQRRAIENGTK